MAKLHARLSDHERDSLLITMANIVAGIYDRQLPMGISVPGAYAARKHLHNLLTEVHERETARGEVDEC